jgi:hypothetical protein
MASLIRLDELWVKDIVTGDYATIQLVGDVVISGDKVIRNALADMFDPDNTARRLPDSFRKNNPLSNMHPFVEFSPNGLDGYFWGRSEMCNVGTLQMQMNSRLDGIQRLLRRQEKPPRLMTGSSSINQQRYTALDTPGGYFADGNPNAKMTNLYPELPRDLWESLHELEAMFEQMAGMPPVLRGQGEAGVRSQQQAETLTRNASPRFKDRALSIERSVASLGSLTVAILKAKDPADMLAWLPPGDTNLAGSVPPDDAPALEPPAPGMKPLFFKWDDIPDDVKVSVDSHSSSPAFSYEHRESIFRLVGIGAMTPEQAVEHLHPAGEEDIVADTERREIMREKMLESLPPDLRAKAMAGGRHR